MSSTLHIHQSRLEEDQAADSSLLHGVIVLLPPGKRSKTIRKETSRLETACSLQQ